MSDKDLPSVEDAYRSLRDYGDQFLTAPLVPQPLSGVMFSHPRHGVIEAKADPRVLAACERMYTNNERLMVALSGRCGLVCMQEDALAMLSGHFSLPQLVVGVSGFASRGYSCVAVASALSVAYGCLWTIPEYTPSLVCDGATGAGALGLSGVLAQSYGLPTLGFAALQGMSSMAPRTHMVVGGQTYQDREELVGSAPDLLLGFGGGKGTLNECLASLRAGGSVLSVQPHDSWRKAMDGPWVAEGRLVFCDSDDQIPEALALAVGSVNFASRADRLRVIESHLMND